MSESETDIKRRTWTRKTQVVLDILQVKTTVAEVAHQHDPTPGEIERLVEEGISGMENHFRARPRDIREQYECQTGNQQETLGMKKGLQISPEPFSYHQLKKKS